MPDPFGLIRINPGAAQDADVIRGGFQAAGNGVLDALGITPNSVLGNPERRRKLEAASETVVEETAVLAALSATVPGRAGRIFAEVIAGVEKLEGGQIVARKATATNFLPAPLGIMTPEAVGLQKNFYLPGGVTNYIPGADRIRVLGIAEQRAEDRAASAARLNAGVQTYSTEQLLGIVQGDTAEGRARRIDARINPRFTEGEFVEAAAQELARRTQSAAVATSAAGASTASAAGGQSPVAGAGVLNPIGSPVAMASIQPELIQPVAAAALANQAGATGVRRQLVHERADP